jgi:hypothetical protein
MSRYASSTEVSVDRSRAEIEKTLTRYGAEQFMSGWKDGQSVIAFRLNNRVIQFVLPLPDKNDEAFKLTPTGRRRRNPEDAYKEWEQACRQRWRALNLAIKAKLEAVECGITSFEEEFLAHIVLPGGKGTVGEWLVPQLNKAYEQGKMPRLIEGW